MTQAGEDPPLLCIRLLGVFDLRRDETSLPAIESARAASLLAYLILHADAPQPRQHLAFLLWPDSTESQARTNLRHVLHILRRDLPDADQLLDVTPRTLRWRADAPCWVDVAAFDDAVSRAERAGDDGALAALRDAVELYTGDLLAGHYDEWLLGERERLRQCYLGALDRLAALLETDGDSTQAIRYAERLLREDSLREETYRLLMRLHDARGDRARALHVYHACAATLERELSVAPSARTHETYEMLVTPAGQPAATEQVPGRIGGPALVGRTPEWTHLTALWRAAEGGRAQFVLITGEAGVGKSRLVEELRLWCEHRGALTAGARSYAAEGALAFGPVVEWLRTPPFTARFDRLDRGRLSELGRLLPELLTDRPGLDRPEPLPEVDQRPRLFDAMTRAIAAAGPLLLVADDLHWCDRDTLQFIHYLLRAEPNARLLVAATARSEEIDRPHPLNELLAGLHTLDRLTELPIGRLNRAETAALAERFAGRPLAPPDADRLYQETEGNPLFVVEALHAGWSGEGETRGWLSPKVQTVIESRLAQVSEATRALVGVAATIGRAFTTDVLAAASATDAETLVRGLDELWRRRIVREQEANAYDFSHDKIREVAYQTLSPAQRRRNHLRVALALERLHADDPGPVSGQMAAHFEQAGTAAQAVTWYARAADAAQQLHASVEAVRLLDRALDLLRTLPETTARDARELEILTALPPALGAVEGWTSERLTEVHSRALDVADALGVEPAAPLLRSLAVASLSRLDFDAVPRFGGQLRARGERDADDVLVVESAYVLGIAAFWTGDLAAARGHFETAVERYRPKHRHTHLIRYGFDPKVICLSRLGNTLWFLGRPKAAMQARDDALALAEEIGHPFSRAIALVFAALLALEMEDIERLRGYTAMLGVEREVRGATHTGITTEALVGFLDVLDGREAAGIARIRRTLDDAGDYDHAPGMRSYLARVLLEACVVAGTARDGLAAADLALRLGGAARLWEADSRRLRAEFLATLGAPVDEIAREFARALDVAHRQGAIALERRAAASLLRWRLGRGDESEANAARARLAKIVARFPEADDGPRSKVAAMLNRDSVET